MSQPVQKPKTQKLAPGRRVRSAVRNSRVSTANPGSKRAARIRGRLTDSRRFDR